MHSFGTYVVRYMHTTEENAFLIDSYGVALVKMETSSYMALQTFQALNVTYAVSLGASLLYASFHQSRS